MRTAKKLFVINLLMAVLLSGMLAGCGGDGAKTDPGAETVRIGVFEPLTGGNAAGGEMTVQGIRLAYQLYPEILGMPVEVVIADHKSEAAEAANAVQRLIEQEKVNIIIGSYGSPAAIAGGPIAQSHQICVIGCSPTHPAVTRDNDYYFRVCFTDPFQGAVMANFALNELGAATAAVIKDMQNEYSVGLADDFIRAFTAVQGEDSIVAAVNYTSGDHDFSAQLAEVNAQNPDLIFAPGNYTECGALIVQARERGMTMPILGGDTWEAPEFLSQVGVWSDLYFSAHFTAEEPVTATSSYFIENFGIMYPQTPVNTFSALGFDAYILAKDAIERAGSLDQDAIRRALAATKDFEGATGLITLDANGDAAKTAIIKQVRDGQFVYVGPVAP